MGEQSHARKKGPLEYIQTRQRDTGRQRLGPDGQQRRQQCWQETQREEERRCGKRAAGAVEDEDRQRDLPEPVSEVVDPVAGRQVAKSG